MRLGLVLLLLLFGGWSAAGRGAHGPESYGSSKKRAKRSLLTEGQGVPLGIAPAGANVNDHKLIRATIESIPIERPKPSKKRPQHLCLDRGYDYAGRASSRTSSTSPRTSAHAVTSSSRARPACAPVAGSSNAHTPGCIASVASSPAGRNAPTPTSQCSTSPVLTTWRAVNWGR